MHDIYTRFYGIGDILAESWRQFKKNFWFIIFTYFIILLAIALLAVVWGVIAELRFGINVEELFRSKKLPSNIVVTPFMVVISAILGGGLVLLGMIYNILPIRIIKSSIDGETLSFVRVLKGIIRRLPAVFVTIVIFLSIFLLLALLFYFGLKDKLDNLKIICLIMFTGLPIYLGGVISMFFVALGSSISVALGSTKNLIGKYWWRVFGIFVSLYAARIIFGGVFAFLLYGLIGSNVIINEVVKQILIYLTGLFITVAMLLTCVNLEAMTGKKLLPRLDE